MQFLQKSIFGGLTGFTQNVHINFMVEKTNINA